jgi:type 1 glutamine amidotransferase
LPSSTNVQCVTITFCESECFYSNSDYNSYEFITIEISSSNVLQCQDKRVAYYLSRAELISPLVKGISTYLTVIAVQNYMHLNPLEKVVVAQRVKKF